MLEIYSEMSDDHIKNATRFAKQLGIDGKYILRSQFNDVESVEKDCLLAIIKAIKERLECEIPKFEVKNQVIRIETLEIIKIFNEFCMSFLKYLSKDSICLLEDGIEKHLENTKNVIGSDIKADVGIIPSLIHETCKHTYDIAQNLEKLGISLIYCYCNTANLPVQKIKGYMQTVCICLYLI